VTPQEQLLISALEATGWHPDRQEDGTLLMGYECDAGLFACVAGIEPATGSLSFYACVPERCPPESRPLVGELLHRLNYGVQTVCFELDYDDGEVRVRSGVDLHSIEPTTGLFAETAETAAQALEVVLPALRALMAGQVGIPEALEMVDRALGADGLEG